jgi:hypothetical protein
MRWHHPITIQELLNQAVAKTPLLPPDANGVYVISVRRWKGEPTPACEPLYIGGNTGKSARFRTRMGDLIADLFGFYCDDTGHHSGGQSLNKHCRKNGIDPKTLFVGWASSCACGRCSEVDLYERLAPKLNRKRPAACLKH